MDNPITATDLYNRLGVQIQVIESNLEKLEYAMDREFFQEEKRDLATTRQVLIDNREFLKILGSQLNFLFMAYSTGRQDVLDSIVKRITVNPDEVTVN